VQFLRFRPNDVAKKETLRKEFDEDNKYKERTVTAGDSRQQ